jgi:hypothetical protein
MSLSATIAQVSTNSYSDITSKISVFIGLHNSKFSEFGQTYSDYMKKQVPYNFSQIINICDAIKDGSTAGAANGAFRYSPVSPSPNLSAEQLKSFINSVIKGNSNIAYVDWCRKINEYKVPANRIVGYDNAINDCGLGSDKLFKDPPARTITSQGNLIDSGPSSHKQGISPWFKDPHRLTVDFLHMFGYTDTSFNFGSSGVLQGFNILGTPYTKVQDLKLGNKQKNVFQDAKQIVYKSLGDRLLVVYAWLFSLANSGERTVLTTCDNVVLLWCMILGVNCIQTQNEKEKDTQKERITRVTHFMSAPINWVNMIKTERDAFLMHYNRSRELLNRMKSSDIIVFAGEVQVPVSEQNRAHIHYIIDGLIRIITETIVHINGMCSDANIQKEVRDNKGPELLTELRIYKPSNLFNGADLLIRSSKKIYSNDKIISQRILVGKQKQYDMYGLFTTPNISEGSRAPMSVTIGGNGKYYGGTTPDSAVAMEEDDRSPAAVGLYDSLYPDEEPYDKNNFDIDEQSAYLHHIIEGKLSSNHLDLSDADYRESLIDLVLDRIVSNYECNYEDGAINAAVSDVVDEERAYAESQSQATQTTASRTIKSHHLSSNPNKGRKSVTKNVDARRILNSVMNLNPTDRETLKRIIKQKLTHKTKKPSSKRTLKPSDYKLLTTLNAILKTASENTKKSRSGVRRSRSQSVISRIKGGRATRKLKRSRFITKKRRLRK